MSVRVVHGANEGYFSLEGKTITQVIRQLRDVMNIPLDAEASVNGKEVDQIHVVTDGDNVEFVGVVGKKGGVQEYWSQNEVIEMFGDDAIDEMIKADINPSRHLVYTADQVSTWQAARVGQPTPRHGLIVDPETFTVSYLGQEPVYLGNKILFRLLKRLAKRPGKFVDFNILRTEVWKGSDVEDATISRTAQRLGEKLNALGVEGVTVEVDKKLMRICLG